MEQNQNNDKDKELLSSENKPKIKNLKINIPLSSTNKFTFNSPNYLNTLLPA